MEDSQLSNYEFIGKLVIRAKSNDNRAFNELLNKFSPLISSTKNRHYDSRWDRKLLDSLVKSFFWEGIIEWIPEEDGMFPGFIRAFLLWKLYNYHKHLKAVEWRIDYNDEQVKTVDEKAYKKSIGVYEDRITLSQLKILKKIFGDIIKGLTVKQRRVVDLYFYKDFTEDGIAEFIECSQPMVNKAKWRALEKINREVNKRPEIKAKLNDIMAQLGIRRKPPKKIIFYSCPKCKKCGFCDKFNGWISKWTRLKFEFEFEVIKDRRKTRKIKKFPHLVVVNGKECDKVWTKIMPEVRDAEFILFETVS